MNKMLIGLGVVFCLAGVAQATPFEITATLTGDPRTENPDNLFINVTITGDDTSSQVAWKVDIASSLHPDAKLDEFYFNLALGLNTVTFGNFSPTGWEVKANENVQGGGSITFNFGALDPQGPPNAADVTNAQDLTFTATLAGGVHWTAAMFYNAGTSVSSEVVLGGGQLGAHLQSLTVPTGTTGMSDSGFLLGNYSLPVPEPTTMLLFGIGIAGLAGIARRKRD